MYGFWLLLFLHKLYSQNDIFIVHLFNSGRDYECRFLVLHTWFGQSRKAGKVKENSLIISYINESQDI